MAEQSGDNQVQYLLSDFNTRLRDLDERNKLIRERVLLLGKNLIETKEELDEVVQQLKKDNSQMKKDLEKLKQISKNIVEETDKFVKRSEIVVVERMLKDFQPLEFMRKKDVEDLINEKFSLGAENKQIKTSKTK